MHLFNRLLSAGSSILIQPWEQNYHETGGTSDLLFERKQRPSFGHRSTTKQEVMNIGIFGGIAGVIAAPFVLATCVMGAGPLIVMGLPVAGAALAINEIENGICKGL